MKTSFKRILPKDDWYLSCIYVTTQEAVKHAISVMEKKELYVISQDQSNFFCTHF